MAQLPRRCDLHRPHPGPWGGLGPWGSTALIVLLVLLPAVARADANLPTCLRWRSSSGLEHIQLGNRLGAANLLTKNQKLDPGAPDGSRPLYRDSDIARLCRSY
ncbi:hypothetical protein [Cyanobium sp. Morenito 9A2]|uniref:hypothetical protein n=1 Tax=Cyanobium sp. Morenito 9A2 TaxID=2823718 RepID=UPI0020CB8366|nr:hypothetical protein [Cyanobium sp. Morenito 9A2]MCP9850154.1 hypothetical protein [Cyanobium sp. Morenito 9A2]